MQSSVRVVWSQGTDEEAFEIGSPNGGQDSIR